jgi:hypothetical protein
MASQTKTPPVFEIYLKGSGVRPEAIPLTTLSQILSAIQRLTAGPSVSHHEKEEEDVTALRLLNIKRGSTTLPMYVPAQDHAIDQLRIASRVIENPDTMGDNDYILKCMKDLSAASRFLGCPIVVRKPGKNGEVFAAFDENTYKNVTKDSFVSGTTSIVGKVERVGNATGARCELRVPIQDRMIFCKVRNIDLARKLGQLLYEEVVVHGEAMWLKTSWKIIKFEITGVTQPIKGSLDEALEALRNAGGDGWDRIDDPVAYIEEMTG